MTNNDMLQNIEYLREKANVTYEEAMDLLQANNGDVMRVLIELEKQGRLYSQPDDCCAAQDERRCHSELNEAKGKAASFFNKARRTRLIVERKNKYDEKETIANVSALFAAGVTICFPCFTFATVILMLVTGHLVRVETRE